mmetsp:Transcript_6395/g.9106  ORF Transcript_6395/g.9106 Transcript_6395/m.9106 type:complete len:162 (-) Transcript_6395:11-496(-)
MASKVVKMSMNMIIKAGTAGPSPPVGPKIGSMGLNIVSFCKEFNARTENILEGVPIRTRIVVFQDKSYDLSIFTPPTSYFILRMAGVPLGSHTGSKENVGEVTVKAVYEIAKIKQADEGLKHAPLKSVCRAVISTARSCGVLVVRERTQAVYPEPRSWPQL